MKVYLGKYRDHWLSPYTILEKIFFWRKIDYDEPVIEKLSAAINPVCVALQKVLNFLHPEIRYIKIDYWDTWNMDGTLARIILPMLKQLKATKQGAPFVDDEDVPDELKSTNALPKENEWDTDSNHFLRWDWVIDEMIFAFESEFNNWADSFTVGEVEYQFKKTDDGHNRLVEGPNHTAVTDWEGMERYRVRIQNGFRLFGKYYSSLWD